MTTTIEELATLPALHTTDTVVIRNPLEPEKGVETTLYVTSTESDDTAELVGTYRTVVGSWGGDGWLDHITGNRVYGAPLNPVPVDGHHYRVLGGFVVRFNEHAEDRHNEHNPLSIVAGVGGIPWPFPNDSISTLDGSQWVEIEWDVSTGRQDETRTGVDNTLEGVLLGLGKEADGGVALDPERVAGRMYLLWAGEEDAGDTVRVGTYLPNTSAAGGWHVEGGYRRSGETVRYTTDYYHVPEGELHWAELALVEPEPAGEDDATAMRNALRSKIATAESEWESFDEALNELATDKGWCEEFEEIVKPFGLTGRTGTYDVEVEVEFTIEDDDPSSNVDERLSSQYDLTMVASSVTINAKSTVTIYGLTLRNPENAYDEISTSDVESALENALSGATVLSVNDWSVESWDKSGS